MVQFGSRIVFVFFHFVVVVVVYFILFISSVSSHPLRSDYFCVSDPVRAPCNRIDNRACRSTDAPSSTSHRIGNRNRWGPPSSCTTQHSIAIASSFAARSSSLANSSTSSSRTSLCPRTYPNHPLSHHHHRY